MTDTLALFNRLRSIVHSTDATVDASAAALLKDPAIRNSHVTVSNQGIISADVDIERNIVISELFGDITTQARYKSTDRNTYFMSAKPRRFVFFFQLDSLLLCLDARTCNHYSRYLQSSDDPNARLTVILCSNNPTVGVITSRRIIAGEVITLPQWRPGLIEVVRTTFSSIHNENGKKVKTVKQWCIWNGDTQHRFTRRLVWNEAFDDAVENKVIKLGTSGMTDEWNDMLYSLGIKTFNGWCCDGITLVQVQTSQSGPMLDISKDEDETVKYPLVHQFRDMYPWCDMITDFDYEPVRLLNTSIDLVSYNNSLHALKIVQEPDDLELFVSQASALAKLIDSPHIIRLTAFISMPNPYDVHSGPVVYGFLTEYCDKGDLQTLLRSEDVSWDRKLKWAKQVVCGIQDMHSLELVHGDLKCHNVVIDTRDNAKVLDMCSGGITHGYCWPSDVDDEKRLASFDIYSLGVVFWELSGGESPQFGVPPVVTNLKCPSGYAELVRICVAKVADDRPSIAEILERINEIQEANRQQGFME